MTADNRGSRRRSFFSIFRNEPVAWGSGFVALCALFVSMCDSRRDRYHDRLSLLPHLEFEQKADPATGEHYFALVNNGLGPARLTGFEYSTGQHFQRFDAVLDFNKVAAAFPGGYEAFDSLGDVIIGLAPLQTFVAPGQKIEIVRLRNPQSNAAAIRFAQFLSDSHVLVCYASVYGDKFYVSDRAGASHYQSCRFDGTYVILGRRYRMKFFPRGLNPSVTHGYPD
jgi:hypothetical protein